MLSVRRTTDLTHSGSIIDNNMCVVSPTRSPLRSTRWRQPSRAVAAAVVGRLKPAVLAAARVALGLWVLLFSLVVTAAPASSAAAQRGNEAGSLAETLWSGYREGMFALYQSNRDNGIANLITADFLLLAYSQIRQQRITSLELTVVAPALENLLELLLADIENNPPANPEILQACRGFLQLLHALWHDRQASDAIVAAEQQRVMAAQGVSESPLWQTPIDYSQFLPRGRYSASAPMMRYFRTMRYANSRLFGLVPSVATGITAQRANLNTLIARDLSQRLNQPALAFEYRRINQALAWQFGAADDLTSDDINTVVDPLRADAAADDLIRQQLIRFAKSQRKTPKIISSPIDTRLLSANQAAADVLIGWRLMPSRLAADNIAMQHLLYRRGDSLVLDCPACSAAPATAGSHGGRTVKGYPSYLEIMSLLGSSEADARLDKNNLRAYTHYALHRARASEALGQAEFLDKWRLSLIRSLLVDSQDQAAALRTATGFWIWQKYLDLLYQKQPYSAQGRNLSIETEAPRPGAWLSGGVENYQALHNLIIAHQRHDADPVWDTFSQLTDNCLQISRAIAQQQPLTAAQNRFLNHLDTKLISLGAGQDQPVVVDIHTNPNDQQVSTVATLYPDVVNRGAARGAVFTVAEFKVAMDKRLTVEKWRSVLKTLAATNKSDRSGAENR